VLCFLQVALAGVWLYRVPFPRPRFLFPSAVRPLDSRCLWTGFAIQLIRASRRIALCDGLWVEWNGKRAWSGLLRGCIADDEVCRKGWILRMGVL